MYQREVPQYGALLELVAAVNADVLTQDAAMRNRLQAADELNRLAVERHGAIRVGTAEELGMLVRVFSAMGMQPVGYYDLAPAGVPVHSTAFRPITGAALRHNPFRLFTSLLRLELIADADLRERARRILAARDIFTPALRELVTAHEHQGGLTDAQADRFVDQALETFRWHEDATVDIATYEALQAEHRLIADVVCFRGPHINHLTPRTLDIDEAQRRMPDYGMTPKAVIEGPPRRDTPILLRQTSFKALEEPIRFAGAAAGRHTARFGEIEQRGIALTPAGRALYDRLLAAANAYKTDAGNADYQAALHDIFQAFPDDAETLRQRELAYFHYQATGDMPISVPADGGGALDALLAAGAITAHPIIYEDFLPVSAAGIFQSNLGDNARSAAAEQARKSDLEQALGRPIIDEFALYADIQARSKQQALAQCRALSG